MELFRLVQSRYGKTLNGKGAAISGGRWNSTGIEIIYTAANRSLAMAEVAVHFSLATLPAGYMMMTIHAPDDLTIAHVQSTDLPSNWNQWPPIKETQLLGDRFIKENKACLLKVPSAVTQGDFNYLIHPAHAEFKKIKIVNYEAFLFDKRLFKPDNPSALELTNAAHSFS